MIVGPRYKVCKRLGNSVYEKCQTQKYALRESRRQSGMRIGRGRPRRLSDYGKQLLEKQRVRATYGITEKQLSRYVSMANKKQGDPGSNVLVLLETRLDNVLFRLGLATTRRGARQMVSHRHVRVNDKKASIPSHHVSANDVITVREKSKNSPLYAHIKEGEEERSVPTWLDFNRNKLEGKVKSIPTRESIEALFDIGIVMEYYSR
ncbi:30S ribosomal protein S4 [Patescibacteria group bacterium]|nr:30S ribosomal protein S4 [Patescibacteria group bacterium]